ncbi:MAG: ABC transporter ATP-binding protein [Acidobacteria bacterium]|nr:ABC transporter ATP-binding protein [Acidobacteriota bacterium]
MKQHHEEEILGKAYDARLMKRLLAYLRPYKPLVALSFLAILLHSGLQAVGPFLTKVAIDRYLAATARQPTFLDAWLSPHAAAGLAQVAALYLLTLLVSFAVDFLQTYSMQLAGQKVMFDLRMQIFGHLQKLHAGFFDRNPVGRLVTRLTTDVDALNEMFSSGVIAVFGDFFTLAAIVGVMVSFHAPLALVSFSVLPLIVLATALFRRRVRDSYRRIRTAIARINAYLQEHITGMAVVQLFNREQKSFEEFDEVNRRHMRAFKDSVFAHSLFYPTIEVLSATAIALILWYGGLRVMGGTLTLGVVVAFIQYAQRFYRPIQDLSEKYNILQGAMASSERIFKLLDTPPEIVSPAAPARLESPRGRIEFRDVWFAYKNGAEPEWVLKDVSFTIEPDETIAIVGHTGAGKTTMMNLLLRFYDPQRGQILLDGVDLRDADLKELRRMFGVVLQDPFLFSGTVERNIRLGSDHLERADLEEAAEEVNLADFIRALTGGFDEEVRERGATLSTGQKQLISFARALAHRPRILVLDEATSSVDTETEFRVRDALGRMVEGRTSIIIAHRLSTVQSADRILVMHKGRLRESGTHQELLAARGIYWKLYQLQYKDQESRPLESKFQV